MGWFKKIVGEPGPKMVRVAVARHEPESTLLLAMLHDAGIPAVTQLVSGVQAIDPSPGDRRFLLVPEHFEAEARAVLKPPSDDESGVAGLPS